MSKKEKIRRWIRNHSGKSGYTKSKELEKIAGFPVFVSRSPLRYSMLAERIACSLSSLGRMCDLEEMITIGKVHRATALATGAKINVKVVALLATYAVFTHNDKDSFQTYVTGMCDRTLTITSATESLSARAVASELDLQDVEFAVISALKTVSDAELKLTSYIDYKILNGKPWSTEEVFRSLTDEKIANTAVAYSYGPSHPFATKENSVRYATEFLLNGGLRRDGTLRNSIISY